MKRHVFVLGDVHGHHRLAQQAIAARAGTLGVSPDLILQVGDFHAGETAAQLESFPAPTKYRKLGDFAAQKGKYPAPLRFIAGNHECVIPLMDMPGGGEVAPRVHYLGRAGVAEENGLRLAWLSGNYGPDYFREPLPGLLADCSNKKELLYIRETEVAALLVEQGPADILLLHEWPRMLDPFWGGPRRKGATVGYPEIDLLVEHLRPQFCFLAHMHYYQAMQVAGLPTQFIALSEVNGREGPAAPEHCCAVLRHDDKGLTLL